MTAAPPHNFNVKPHTMLRLLCLVSLAVASTPSNANCGGGLSGTSSFGQIYIGSGDCEFQEEMIIVSSSEEPSRNRSYRFKKECEYTFAKSGSTIGFRCREGGTSPLAGTRYRMRVSPTETEPDLCEEGARPFPVTYYACTQGCTVKAPARFYIETPCD